MGDVIDDFLSLEPAGDPLPGSSSLSQTRPTLAGLQWLDAPWGKSSGLAYRINGTNTLESLLVSSSAENDDDSPTVISVSDSFTLSAGAVRMTSSHDGRMVAVACCDGSLHCIDATDSCLSLRWSIVDAHSHITPNGNVASPVSTGRVKAACASGPVLSLDFSAENYMLILVDAKRGLTMYDARLVTPTNIVTTQHAGPLLNVSSATWCKSLDNSKRALLAIGRYDGSIAILKYNATLLTLQAATELGCPSEEDGFTCTHLNWWSDTLAVGLCRVIPPDDGEGPDEDDEDDNADHEALLYLAAIHEDLALGKRTEWAEQGDVVPFFTVPKYGRHVFYTCFVKSTSKQLLAVAVNVGTDIGVVAKDSDGGDWSVVEFQEGSSASLPTNEDDEFTYPLGISALQTPSSSFRLLLASTDGSLSTLKFNHANDPAYLAAQLIGDPTKLPADTVALVESPNQLEKQNSSNSDDGSAWVVVDESGKKNLPAVDLPKKAASSTVQSSSSISIGHQQAAEIGSGFSFGKSPIQQTSLNPAFGSGSSAPVFGSGTSIPSFGPSPGTPVFGITPPLGTQDAMQFSSPLTTKATAPTGLGSIGARGFASSESSGGFAALAASYKSGVAIPSSSSNPFSSFSQQSTEGLMASSFPTKPLFGSISNIPTTSTTLATMTLGSDEGSRNQVMSQEKSSKLSGHTDASTPTPTSLLNASSNNPDSEVSVEKSLSEKRPLEVFDQFDTNKSGIVPSSMFEEMLDALGEGFQGEELDAQLALIDPSKTGKLTKSAFVNWYKTLVTSNANENDSLSSGEREERDKEEASARETFKTLSKTVNGKSCIDSDQFEKLIESLGTTYCKEEHEKTLVVLEKDGNRIYEDDFIEWYIGWLFGGDEESITSDEDSANKDDKGSSLDPKKSLGSLFQVSGDSWKCEICSVRNEGIVNKCSACETPRPGSEDAGAPADTAGAGSIGSSIGPGGFTFGGSVTGALNASSGFNFGTSAPVTSVPAPSSGGIKFDSSASTSGAPSSGGFHFQTTQDLGNGTPETQSSPIHSTSAAFPPSASKGPTPFSSMGTPSAAFTNSDSSSSSAFPPSSSKPPTQFSSVGAKSADVVKSGSSSLSAFPPSSSKAPTPFSSVGSKLAAAGESVVSPAFPPSSSKGPTPFSLVGSPSAAFTNVGSSSSSAFPPSSSKAPTPFSSVGVMSAGVVKSGSSSSSAFTPSSSKASRPFSSMGAKSADVVKSGSSSSSSFPPSSSKAPTPFSSVGSKSAAAGESVTSPAFPPSSSKVPTPLSSVGTPSAAFTKSGSISSAFPPSSSKAPTPFSSVGAKSADVVKSGSSSSSAFPPSSSKAPTPFSSVGTKSADVVKSGSSSSSAFPPTSSKAPTPFSSVGAKSADVVKSGSSSSSSSFPPSSSKAPTPFSSMGSKLVAAGESVAPPAFPLSSSKGPTPFSSMSTPSAAFTKSGSSSSSAFPPSSSKAPTPFSSVCAKSADVVKSGLSSSSAFLPSSSKGPVSFSTAFASGVEKDVPELDQNPAPSLQAPSPQHNNYRHGAFPGSSAKNTSSKHKSDVHLQFDTLCSHFEKTLTELSGFQLNSLKESQTLRIRIEELVTKTQQERANLLDIDESLKKRKEDFAFLLSRKTDLSRHIDASLKLIENLQLAELEAGLIDTQLDQDSEMRRRKFAATSWRVNRDFQSASRRLNTLELVHSSPGGGSRLLKQVADFYKCTRDFETKKVLPISKKVSLASQNVPKQQRPSEHSTNSFVDPSLNKRNSSRGTPVGIRSISKAHSTETPKMLITRWRATELSIQSIDFRTTKFNKFNDRPHLDAKKKRDATSSRRYSKPSLLLGLTPPTAPREVSSSSIDLFSPSSEVTARDAWDKPSTIEREKMSQMLSTSAPTELKQTTFFEASRPILSKIGSNPEKLQSSIGMTRNDEGMAKRQSDPKPVKKSQRPNENATPAAFSDATSQLPPRSIKPSQPSQKKNAPSTFPSQTLGIPKVTSAEESGSKNDQNERVNVHPSTEKGAPKGTPTFSGFGNMNDVGASLFDIGVGSLDGNRKTSAVSTSALSTAEPIVPQRERKDYKAMLTTILKKSNPDKLGSIDAFLEKYKGNEETLITKTAKKYNVANPLDEKVGLNEETPGTRPIPPSTAPVSSSFDSVPPGPSTPFGSAEMTGSMTSQNMSSFSTTSAPQNQPTFGLGSASTNVPFPAASTKTSWNATAPSLSPFAVNDASSNFSTPLGSQTVGLSSTTPFGASGGLSSSTTPFGTQPSAPFGSPDIPQSQPRAPQLFNGKPARDLLIQFYQEMNPSKLSKVDEVLQKYNGKEDEMFRKIALQYKIDPAKFGLSNDPATASFGSPSPAPAFGQSSTIGGGRGSFTQGGSGFGQPSALGGGGTTSFASNNSPGGHTFGAVASPGFGAASFGSLAQSSPSTFGSPSSGFGGAVKPGGFASPNPGFGTPFGGPRR